MPLLEGVGKEGNKESTLYLFGIEVKRGLFFLVKRVKRVSSFFFVRVRVRVDTFFLRVRGMVKRVKRVW